jgi:hypothetical protein
VQGLPPAPMPIGSLRIPQALCLKSTKSTLVVNNNIYDILFSERILISGFII